METAEKGELHDLLFASCVTVAAKHISSSREFMREIYTPYVRTED